MAKFPIPVDAKIYIAGHAGLVGGAIWKELIENGFVNLIGRRSDELDLRDRESVYEFFVQERPDVVIDAAARVGGIHANNAFPADFLSDNLRIQLNIMDSARSVSTPKLLFLGSSCIYPKFATQPIREESLLTGELEPTNDAYAIAKIAGIMQVQATRRQDGLHWISAMPTNLYGPGDNFHPSNSHVLPAMIRRFHEAKIKELDEVVIWGTGTPRREFLHVNDLAKACVFLLQNYDSEKTINVGVGEDITILELAKTVAEVVGYQGKINTDSAKPDGTPRKLLDVSRITNLGWQAEIPLKDGIKATYAWYLENIDNIRSK